MAKAASKKQAAQNAMMIKILTYGFLISNLIHILIIFGPFRSKRNSLFWPILKYFFSELIAGILGISLFKMSKQGDDLSQQGLTSYMFDVIYITWFIHITTALISTKFWYFYFLIPGFACFTAYKKLIVPFIFKGNDPIKSLFSNKKESSSSSAAFSTSNSNTLTNDSSNLSKRQAKLQKRAERGDPRIQMRNQ